MPAPAAKEDTLPPKPTRYVTDRAGVLGGRAEALDTRLEDLEKETSNQILVWTDRRVRIGAQSNVYEGKGRATAESLLRQWRCCLQLQP